MKMEKDNPGSCKEEVREKNSRKANRVPKTQRCELSDDFVMGEVMNESTDVRSEYTESTA